MTDRSTVVSAFLAIAITTLYSSAVQAQGANPDWIIVPGERVGPITATTSEAVLETLFGSRNIERVDVQIGEGFTEPGTTIYPGEATKRLEVVWRDGTRTAPREIRLTGETSMWKTQNGLSLGSALKEIESLNGGPFRLAGFAWDYSGTILDCGGGRLTMLGCVDPEDRTSRTHQRSIIVRLNPDHEARTRPEFYEVLGDGEFSSGHPAMQALNPRVYQMIIFLSR